MSVPAWLDEIDCSVTHAIAREVLRELSSNCKAVKTWIDGMHDNDWHNLIVNLCGVIKNAAREVAAPEDYHADPLGLGLEEPER
jgi:hypothetical protein